MSKIYFHPDIDYQGIRDIEKKYNSTDQNYLINKASDAVSIKLQQLLKKTDNSLFVCGPGSNGLDALFASYKLLNLQYNISIFFTQENIHLEYINKFNLTDSIVNKYDTNNDYNFIIDGIFGYGLNRNLSKNSVAMTPLSTIRLIAPVFLVR